MSYFVEHVHYRTEAADDELVTLRRSAILAVRAAHPDLVDVPALSHHADGTWVDVWVYRSQEAAEAANDNAANIPEFMALAAVLTDVDIQAGSMPENSESPL